MNPYASRMVTCMTNPTTTDFSHIVVVMFVCAWSLPQTGWFRPEHVESPNQSNKRASNLININELFWSSLLRVDTLNRDRESVTRSSRGKMTTTIPRCWHQLRANLFDRDKSFAYELRLHVARIQRLLQFVNCFSQTRRSGRYFSQTLRIQLLSRTSQIKSALQLHVSLVHVLLGVHWTQNVHSANTDWMQCTR